MVDESAAAPDSRIGSLVDERYKVIEAMASGSMGVVYKAERVPVGKLVAIKFLHAPFANDSEFLGRFERETRVMSKLNHPNCVSVVDFGVWDGAPYLVMEYVSGTTLRALIDNGPLPPRRALALIRQIAAGLAHAHAQGVVHRDVKPANIMVSEEIGTGDHVRILDFGLARLRGAVGRDATQSNVVVGTPNYMAPEQTVGGGVIDARTDIYAAGVVLFEMVSGERPFQADDTLALLGMHRAAPIPRLVDLMSESIVLPRGLQDIVDQAMAKSPGERFQSAIELAEAIDSVTSASGSADGDGSGPVIRRGTEARRAAGHAPTVLDVSDDAELLPPEPPRARSRGGFFGSLILLAILAGGVGAAVWWIKARSGSKVATALGTPSTSPGGPPSAPESEPPPPARVDMPSVPQTGSAGPPAEGSAAGAAGPGSEAGSAAGAPGSDGSAAPTAALSPGSAALAGSGGGDTGSSAPGAAAGSAEATAPGTPEPKAPVAGQGSDRPGAPSPGAPPSPAAGAPDTDDIEMDPATADDPAPASARPANAVDEAANAPKTTEEAERHDTEKRPPAAPSLATSVRAAVQLIEDGKHELAMASLHALGKKNPASAYIPFLLGNLYYDRQWWTVAMDHYAVAIKKNGQYRSNPTIIRNVIRMMASDKTSRKAQGFLKFTVGRPALPYVRYAAAHDANGQVRRAAGWLARNL
jgi:serine/threonine-protein kinase